MAIYRSGACLPVRVHHLQEDIVLACEPVGIEPDRKMYLEGIVGDLGSGASGEEAPAVPQRRISSRCDRPEIFAGLIGE
jgi:hypothetical protein